jgi:amino acid adenylation domain-containing protein
MSTLSLMSRFAESCIRFADSIAIEWRDQRLTYRELNEKSTHVAARLIESGVESGQLVVVALKNSFEVVPVLLGIWKAGCVFVPVDRSNPEKRLHLMFSAIEPDWIITDAAAPSASSEKVLRFFTANRVIRFEEGLLSSVASLQMATERGSSLSPDGLAYLTFTSGSTGLPKAIGGRLKGIAHFIEWEASVVGAREGLRVSQLTHPAFDAFFRDLFLALSKGGTICIPDGREAILDAPKLVRWIDQREVNVIHCVPSLFRSILAQPLHSGLFQKLKYVLLAGEAVFPSDVKTWMSIFDERIQLINLYGATETTMVKFFHSITRQDAERRSIPIGKPIANTRALIVSPEGQACPPYVAGEIYVRTPYASLGYYKDPELTRQVFVPNPFSQDPTDLVYKTGDMGRMLPDGTFEFLGRMDFQVKLHGQRVELAEIDTALRAYEGVKDAVTIALSDGGSEPRLVSYVAAELDLRLPLLRDHLLMHLPASFLPATIVRLDKLPLTANGKVDRKALPQPVKSIAVQPVNLPQTEIEKQLAAIWCELLGMEAIDTKDDFFAVGGHSLMATQLMARVRQAFEVDVPLGVLLQEPTIAHLSHVIEQQYVEEATDHELLDAMLQTGSCGDDSRGYLADIKNQVRELPRADLSNVAAMLQKRKTGKLPAMAIPRISGNRVVLPLSYAQKRLWFTHQLQPLNSFDNVPLAIRLSGPINIDALAASLRRVVERHEVLRTNFAAVEGEPYSFLSNHAPLQLNAERLTIQPEDEALLEAAMRDEVSVPFDLGKDPLIRLRLFSLGDQDHVLLITMHHIVADGRSKGYLANQLAAFYKATLDKEEPSLPELTIQYGDYAQWQNDLLLGEALGSELDYWRKRLQNAPPLLELPFDHADGLSQESYECRRYHFSLSASLSKRLKELARREAVTLFTVLMAAYQVLLAKYTSQDDIIIGTPVSGRNRMEIEPLIGFFLNILAIRTDLSGEPSFLEVLRQLKTVVFGAYANQNFPFEKLVEVLHPERSHKQSPFFQNVFIFENDLTFSQSLQSVQFTALKFDKKNSSTPYHLTLYMADEGVLTGAIEYRRDLFDEATVARMVNHFKTLLEGIETESEKRISDLNIVDGEELATVRKVSEGESVNSCCGGSLADLFEEQARRTPATVAVVCRGQEWTYSELERRANQLANHLLTRGLASEGVVGIAMEPSAEMIVALLGVLKAGGAYLPLDPAYPPERLRYMATDSGANLVLVREGASQEVATLNPLAGFEGIEVINIEAAEIQKLSNQAPARVVWPDHLAYVLYTSGSTGRPKGVMATHAGAVNRFAWMWQKYPFERDEICCQKTSLNFGDSVWEIFGPLLAGVRLIIVATDEAKNASKLTGILAENKVSRIVLVPTLLRAILENEEPNLEPSLGQLKLCTVSGEELPGDLARLFHEKLPGRTLLNLYGASEVSADVSWFEDGKTEDLRPRSCIGKPIANTRIYVLDSAMNAVPIGIKGELYVGGAGLARGYLGRPDLTAERFVPDPFATDGQRLYRTGDQGRYLPDGTLEYWGRNDQQVKIRGQRVELEEIARVLEQHSAVEKVIVLAIDEKNQNRYLAAYIVPKGPQDQAVPETMVTDDLRRLAASKLPRHMIPAKWTVIRQIPHLPSGKVDRSALRLLMVADGAALSVDPPRGPVEEAVANMWKQVLGRENVGRTENFFDLGGHSLLAVRVIAKIKTEFSVDVPLPDFFDIASVAALAERIENVILAATDDSKLEEILRIVENMGEDVAQ